MKHIVTVLCIAATLSACGEKKTADETSKTATSGNITPPSDSIAREKDREFVLKASEGGLYEVKMGELALKNASSKDVKAMAQMIVDDHSKANGELKELASRKNFEIADSLGADKKKIYDDYKLKKGNDFDRDYTLLMLEDHRADIELFTRQSEGGNDQELKTWAAGKLPVLKHHLEMAEKSEKEN